MRARIAHTISRRIATAIAIAIVLAALGLSLGQAIGIFRVVPVLSGSMDGFVSAGDAAVLRPVPVSELTAGDVIAFHPPIPNPPLTLHRITDLDRAGTITTIRTKGDANALGDPWRAQLQDGTAWRANGVILQGAGTPVLALQRPTARLVLLAVTISILLVAVLRRIWEEDPADQVRRAAPRPAAAGAATTSLSVLAIAALSVVLTARVLGGAPVAASFTGGDSASQNISTSWEDPPTELRAELICDLGLPTSVRISWTASASPAVVGYTVERGPAEGPFVGIGDTRDTTFVDDAVDAVLAGADHYRVRGLTVDGTTPATEPVSLLGVCTPSTSLLGDTADVATRLS